MHEKTIDRIQRELEMRETEDLQAIWEADDREEWSAEAFEAIRRILTARLGRPPERSRTAQARELLEEAETLYEADDFERAIALCERAIALAPELAEAHNFQGFLYDTLGETKRAARAYREAVRLDPDFTVARDNLNELLAEWDTQSEEQALDELLTELAFPAEASTEPVSAVGLQKARALLSEAKALFEAEDYTRSLDLCERAIILAPGQAEAHNLQGLLYDAQDEIRLAAAAYREALRLEPGFSEARENLKEVLAEMAEQDEDLDLTEVYFGLPQGSRPVPGPATETAIKRAGALVSRASELEESGDLEGAVAACEKALQLAPNSAAAHNMRGVLYDRAGEPGLAINEYHEAVRLNPRFRQAAANLSEALVDWYEEFGQASDAEVDLVAMYESLPPEEKSALAKDPRWGADIPGAFYLDESGVVLEGWSGNRLQPGNSGYDPLTSDFETAQVQGILLRQLFTGTLRVHNPIYLAVMFFLGGMFVIPLILSLAAFLGGQGGDPLLILLFGALSIPGFALIWNAYMSVVDLS